MPTVVVHHDLPIADALRDRWDDLTVVATSNPGETASTLAEAECLVCNPTNWDDRYLDGLGPGDWIQATSAGYDAFPIERLRERGVTFTNAAGIHDPIVAEHVFALTFAFSRLIPEFAAKQNERVWGPRADVSAHLTDWKDRTLTIFGLGSIGEAVASRALAFDMEVYGIKRTPEDYAGCLPADRVLGGDAFHDVLEETDLLVVTVPLTDATHHAIDDAVFRALPDSAILINVARGPVVDEAALEEALQAERLAGAGLDVFESEPLPEASPLWSRDDVLVTPHVGGRSNNFTERFAALFAENYERWRTDDSLSNRIA